MPLVITTQILPPGAVGYSYTANLQAKGGVQPYSWQSSLPDGLTLDSLTGAISGTPTVPLVSSVLVGISDSGQPILATSVYLLLRIQTGPLTITPTGLPDCTAGSPFSYQFAGTGGKLPYSWSLRGGILPAGLTLDSSGLIGGTTDDQGHFPLDVALTDASGTRVHRAYNFDVKSPARQWKKAYQDSRIGQNMYLAEQAGTLVLLFSRTPSESSVTQLSKDGITFRAATGEPMPGNQSGPLTAGNAIIWQAGGSGYPWSNICKFDLAAEDWTLESTTPPFSRLRGNALTWFDGKLWVMGGSNCKSVLGTLPSGSVVYNTLWSSSDGMTWTQMPTPAWSPRTMAACAAFDGKLWLSGGRMGITTNYAPIADMWAATDGINWEQIADIPWASRTDVTAVSLVAQGELLYVATVTGDAWSGPVPISIWAMTKDGKWTQLPSPPDVYKDIFFESGLAIMDNHLYLTDSAAKAVWQYPLA